MSRRPDSIFTYTKRARVVIFFILASLLTGTDAQLAASKLIVAISPDLPPYVLKNATGGLEVDMLRQALPNYTLEFIQMPYAELQTAIPTKRADISVGVQHFKDDGVFYSDEFITFENVAITKKAAGLKIDSIADLANHKVLTWQDAYLELGPEFKSLFSPDSPNRKNYVEIGDQREQVRMFWRASDDVIVIDRHIFNYFSAAMRHMPGELVFHSLFAPVTNFRVGFKDAALRDAFNQGLVRLCKSGEYENVLKRYNLELSHTICDR